MQAAAAIVRCLAGPATTSAVGHAGEGRLLAASCDPDVRFAQSYRSAAPPSAPASLSRLSAGNPNYVRQALSDAPDDPLNRHRFIVVALSSSRSSSPSSSRPPRRSRWAGSRQSAACPIDSAEAALWRRRLAAPAPRRRLQAALAHHGGRGRIQKRSSLLVVVVHRSRSHSMRDGTPGREQWRGSLRKHGTHEQNRRAVQNHVQTCR